jgi:hypothetical protein
MHLWVPRGWRQWNEFGPDLVDAGWLFGELPQERKDKDAGHLAPSLEADAVTDGWLRGDVQLHLKLGITTRLPAPHKCHLCAHIQRVGPAFPTGLVEQRKVPKVRDFYIDTAGESPEWLDRPVLIASIDARQKHKRVVSSRATVRLTPTQLCRICAPNAGKLLPKAFVVFDSVLEDREGDGLFLLSRQLARGCLAARDERPCQVVERGPVVVGDVPEKQSPARGDRRNLLDDDGEAVAFRLVLRSEGPYWISVSVACAGLDVSLQRLGVDYRLRPLQPSALKPEIDGHDQEPTPPAQSSPRDSAHTSTAREW